MPERDALERLIEDGFVRRDGTRLRTSPRWQAALARAALGLQRSSAPWQDLRLPIAAALCEHYRGVPDEDIAHLVEAMLPVEEGELAPLFGVTSSGP